MNQNLWFFCLFYSRLRRLGLLHNGWFLFFFLFLLLNFPFLDVYFFLKQKFTNFLTISVDKLFGLVDLYRMFVDPIIKVFAIKIECINLHQDRISIILQPFLKICSSYSQKNPSPVGHRLKCP